MFLRVLIVEDSLAIRNKLQFYIESMEHEVVFMAKNGKEGIEAAKEFRPDVITMDINMPDINGIEAMKQIMAEDFDVDFIMITSIGQNKIVMSALSAGAIGYLLKPIDQTKIAELFSHIWNKRASGIKIPH